MSCWVDIKYWCPASVARIFKYVAKGFECAVPGVRREAFATPTEKRPEVRMGCHYNTASGRLERSSGLNLLFDAEAEVLKSRFSNYVEEDYVEEITGRLTIVEAATIASKIAGKLGSGIDEPERTKHTFYGAVVGGTGTCIMTGGRTPQTSRSVPTLLLTLSGPTSRQTASSASRCAATSPSVLATRGAECRST